MEKSSVALKKLCSNGFAIRNDTTDRFLPLPGFDFFFFNGAARKPEAHLVANKNVKGA